MLFSSMVIDARRATNANLCLMHGVIAGDAHHRRPQKAIFDAVAAANLLEHGTVRVFRCFDRAKRFMHARVKLLADCFHVRYAECAHRVVQLLGDQLDTRAELLW